MIGIDKIQDYEFINLKIEKIIKSSEKLKNDKVVAKLKELIPEFISNNSSYQSLDKIPFKLRKEHISQEQNKTEI
jgi:hypothetical protein